MLTAAAPCAAWVGKAGAEDASVVAETWGKRAVGAGLVTVATGAGLATVATVTDAGVPGANAGTTGVSMRLGMVPLPDTRGVAQGLKNLCTTGAGAVTMDAPGPGDDDGGGGKGAMDPVV